MKDLSIHTIRWYRVGALLAIVSVILWEAGSRGDFYIYLSASADLLQGDNIYRTVYLSWYHYYYSVLFALVLYPITFLPLYLAKVLWLMLNAWLVFRSWRLLENYLPVSSWTGRRLMVFRLLCFIFTLRFLRDNIHLAQMTIFLLWSLLEGVSLIRQEKKITGSLILAFSLDIKVLPMVIIPYLFYRKEWKSVIYIMVFVMVFLAVPGLVLGFDHNLFLLTERWKLINPGNQEHILDVAERSFHSITTLLSTLLVKNTGDSLSLPLKRNLADISLPQLALVINLTRIMLILCALYFLRSRPFRRQEKRLHQLYELSYILLITPLIFPHQQQYAFLLSAPAIVYVLYYTFCKYFSPEVRQTGSTAGIWKKRIWLGLLFLVYFLLNSHFILGEFREWYDHFKTLTYGILLLGILLAFCPPRKLRLGNSD